MLYLHLNMYLHINSKYTCISILLISSIFFSCLSTSTLLYVHGHLSCYQHFSFQWPILPISVLSFSKFQWNLFFPLWFGKILPEEYGEVATFHAEAWSCGENDFSAVFWICGRFDIIQRGSHQSAAWHLSQDHLQPQNDVSATTGAWICRLLTRTVHSYLTVLVYIQHVHIVVSRVKHADSLPKCRTTFQCFDELGTQWLSVGRNFDFWTNKHVIFQITV